MNPYADKGPAQFWRTGVASLDPGEVLPLRAKRFSLPPGTVLSTAGSCFAQNIARHLGSNRSVRVLQAEPIHADQPLFSALYGNIYTVRQLVQLFDEAFGRRRPERIALQRADGRYVDGLRPSIFAAGFATADDVVAARAVHLEAVRRVFTECSAFVFTLGLTEAWRAVADGTVYPIAPGVVSDDALPSDFAFHNFDYAEVTADLDGFVERIAGVNPAVQIVLTVSPVPLAATYTDEHVLVATAHSKAILRAACAAAESRHGAVYYFPAYEIVTGLSAGTGSYYDANLRTVSPQGVAHVMRVFEANLLPPGPAATSRPASPLFSDTDGAVLCDEDVIAKSVGF